MNICETVLNAINNALEFRKKLWVQLRHTISKRAKIEFFYLLEHRGYHGFLAFNHETSELDMIIQPSHDQTKLVKRDIKQLSGGEKSYATSCFLFSLWSTMTSPFFCLDEFDVYMVNIFNILRIQLIDKQWLSFSFHIL